MSENIRKEVENELQVFKQNLNSISSAAKAIKDAGQIAGKAIALMEEQSEKNAAVFEVSEEMLRTTANEQKAQFNELKETLQLLKTLEKQLSDSDVSFRIEKLNTRLETIQSNILDTISKGNDNQHQKISVVGKEVSKNSAHLKKVEDNIKANEKVYIDYHKKMITAVNEQEDKIIRKLSDELALTIFSLDESISDSIGKVEAVLNSRLSQIEKNQQKIEKLINVLQISAITIVVIVLLYIFA